MRIGPLTLFKRMRPATAGVLIAGLHWQGSITWRWTLFWHKRNELMPVGVSSTRHNRGMKGWTGLLSVNLPVLGYLRLQVQPNKFSPGWKAYS